MEIAVRLQMIFPEDPPTGIDGPEHRRVAQLRFRFAEKENTAWIERIVQAIQYMFLRDGVEIDENVPTHNHLHMRNWRILRQIAASEDQHTPHIANHSRHFGVRKIFLPPLRTHAPQSLRRIFSPSCN